MLLTADLDYHLPEGLVATHPASPREAARLLVVDRGSGQHADHTVADLPSLLHSGDLLVVNVSRVLPARLVGIRADTGGRFEGLYLGPALGPARATDPSTPEAWRIMLKAKRPKPGILLQPLTASGIPTSTRLRLIDRAPVDQVTDTNHPDADTSAWLCAVEGEGATDPAPIILSRIGLTPLPPYIQAARKREMASGTSGALPTSPQLTEDTDRADYQTTYAAGLDRAGSVAAPTAGLHFTPALLDALTARGIARAEVVLHVGTGTFKSIETDFVEQHPMHAEWCEIPTATARAIVETRARGGRVIAVGTTSARTLESFGPATALIDSGASGWTRLLITPGHAWQNVDALMTNFHLPRTTLLALVAALLPGGITQLRTHYAHAVASRYRFFSFGDAMLVG